MSKDKDISDDDSKADINNSVPEYMDNSSKNEKSKRKKGRKKKPIDWTAIRAEYIAGDMSLAQLAEQYNVTKSAMQKKSAAGHWSEQRKKKSISESDKIADKLSEYNAKQKVKDIAKVCNAASALIDKIIEATDELRKIELTKKTVKKTHIKTNQDGKFAEVENTVTSFDYETIDGMIDTKKLSNLSKSLANCRSILDVVDSGEDDEIGIIEMPAMTVLEPPEEEVEVLQSG